MVFLSAPCDSGEAGGSLTSGPKVTLHFRCEVSYCSERHAGPGARRFAPWRTRLLLTACLHLRYHGSSPTTGSGRDWASKVDPRFVIAARSLEVDGPGSKRTLADVASVDAAGGGLPSGATLGSGAFGKVGTYLYNGAAVAVKELKVGVDEDSIGTGFP